MEPPSSSGSLSVPMSAQRLSSVDIEGVEVFLRSLNESVPQDMLGEGANEDRKITTEELRACIKDMYMTLGYEYSERLGDLLVYEALHEFDVNHDGCISASELQRMLAEYKKRPRRYTRHPRKCVVFGGGAFGTGMAQVLAAKGHDVVILMREEEKQHVESINTTHINTMCFPKDVLSEHIRAVTDPAEALEGANLIVHAVPVQFSQGYLENIRYLIPADVPIVSTSKGINVKTLGFMCDIFEAALGKDHPCGFISGPSYASGLIQGDPTAATLACKDAKVAEEIRVVMSSPQFRVYTTDDVIGLEVVGALKNVLSIGCGLCKGLGYGANTQAVLVTRGWRDIYKMINKLGGRMETMISLGGLGDLMLTCFGGESRNAAFGQLLAQGHSVEECIKMVGQVVEGYPTAGAAARLAKKLDISTPVIDVMADVCAGKIDAHDVIAYLMSLPLEDEF